MSTEKKKLSWPAAAKLAAAELAARFPEEYDPAAQEASDAALLSAGRIAENELLDVYNRAFGSAPIDENELEQPEPFGGIERKAAFTEIA